MLGVPGRPIATTIRALLVILMGLTLMLIARGGQLPRAEVARAAQPGLIGAAIYAGGCDDPHLPAMALNAFAPAPQAPGPDAPLISSTDIPMTASDLVASPHAILILLGGDLDAILACGELGERFGVGPLVVDLTEANGSGYSGVGLLTAGPDTTQVAVLLAEQPRRLPIIGGTPSPGAATPVAPGTLTPAASPTPTAPASSPTPTATAVTSPYVSEQFGYQIAFGAPWQIAFGPQTNDTSDYIAFSNGVSVVDFLGVREGLSAPECMDTWYAYYRSRDGLRSIVSRPDNAPDALRNSPTQAIEAWDLDYVDSANQLRQVMIYAVCQVLEPGVSYLLSTQESPRDQYPQQAALRDELYRSLTLP
jgi:hypothetical protein